MKSYIADGYTFKAGIDPVDHLHGGLEFKYRPMTPMDSAGYHEEADGKSGKSSRRIQARYLKKHVLSWNLTDQNDNEAKIEESVLLNHLSPSLFNRMFSIVINWEPADYGEQCDMEELEKN